MKMAELSATLGAAGDGDTEDLVRPAVAYALCGQLYEQLNSVGRSSDYGLHAESLQGFGTALWSIQNGLQTDPNNGTALCSLNRGSSDQRLAFLADTDYETFP